MSDLLKCPWCGLETEVDDDFEDIYRKYHSKSYIYATESHNEQN
jgi:hypothetical protein